MLMRVHSRCAHQMRPPVTATRGGGARTKASVRPGRREARRPPASVNTRPAGLFRPKRDSEPGEVGRTISVEGLWLELARRGFFVRLRPPSGGCCLCRLDVT
jgi:hypothetical protein